MPRLSDEALKQEIDKTAWQQGKAFLSGLNEGKPSLCSEMSRTALDEVKNRIIENGCSEISIAPNLSYFQEILDFLPETKIKKITLQDAISVRKTPIEASFFEAVKACAVTSIDLTKAGKLKDEHAENAFKSLLSQKRMTGLGFNLDEQNVLPLVTEIVGNPVSELALKNAAHSNPLAGIIAGLPLKSLTTDGLSALYRTNRENVLPPSIENIVCTDATFATDSAEKAASEFKRLPHIERISFASAATPDISPIVAELGKTTAKSLSLPDLDCAEEVLPLFLKTMEERGCAVTEVVGSKDIPEKDRENLSDLLMLHAKGNDARNAVQAFKHETLDDLLKDKGTTVRTIADKNLLFFAVAENRFDDISDLMKRTNVCLSAKDWLAKDEKGISLLDHAAGVNALSSVFQKHCWKNAQDLQTVWNAVPAARKKQMEHAKEPFSFRRFKNAFMHDMVLHTVQKSAKNR